MKSLLTDERLGREACGVSDRFVNKIGPEVRTIRTSPMPRTRIGRDGKRRCVKIALAEFPDWSDRRIAEACQVGKTLVLTVRGEYQLVAKTSSPDPVKRIGRDGKARSMPTPRETRGWTSPEVAQ